MEHPESTVFTREKDHSSSGLSWAAVIAGAVVAAAFSLILLALGAGFGLSIVSPWSNARDAVSTVGTVAIVWLIATQIISSALGGYLAGRLRTRWLSIHNDEVHFRDTAQGLVMWAVGVVITVSLLTTAATSMAGGIAHRDEPKTVAALTPDPNSYFVDRLLRSEHPNGVDRDLAQQAEVGRLFTHVLETSTASDTNYLTQLVAAKTSLSANDAARRVDETVAEARQAEDKVRQASAHLLLWIFIALLAGAFCASYSATLGGRQRDQARII
jgi:MFS family permease